MMMTKMKLLLLLLPVQGQAVAARAAVVAAWPRQLAPVQRQLLQLLRAPLVQVVAQVAAQLLALLVPGAHFVIPQGAAALRACPPLLLLLLRFPLRCLLRCRLAS